MLLLIICGGKYPGEGTIGDLNGKKPKKNFPGPVPGPDDPRRFCRPKQSTPPDPHRPQSPFPAQTSEGPSRKIRTKTPIAEGGSHGYSLIRTGNTRSGPGSHNVTGSCHPLTKISGNCRPAPEIIRSSRPGMLYPCDPPCLRCLGDCPEKTPGPLTLPVPRGTLSPVFPQP
jgi:hypothetical protein